MLPEHFAEDEDRLRRFEREARTLATLNHPCVAQVYGIDQDGDTCFTVMELVAGEDLSASLSNGPLPLDEAVGICRQIAEGLEAAHEAGVIHRDLKPANVRITPDGAVKILDFGLAKPLPTRGGASGDASRSTSSPGRAAPRCRSPRTAATRPSGRPTARGSTSGADGR